MNATTQMRDEQKRDQAQIDAGDGYTYSTPNLACDGHLQRDSIGSILVSTSMAVSTLPSVLSLSKHFPRLADALDARLGTATWTECNVATRAIAWWTSTQIRPDGRKYY